MSTSKIVLSWSNKGRQLAQEFFRTNMRGEYDEEFCLYEAFIRVSDRVPGIHEPEYELSGYFSKSGNPVSFHCYDDYFKWG